MRRTLTSLAFLAALAAPALADDARILKEVFLQDLQTVLVEEGYTINNTGNDGPISVQATDTNNTGLVFHLIGTACDTDFADGCVGINMQVRYDADGQETLERINDANLEWAATSTWFSDGESDGSVPTVGVSRYVILDDGVTLGNIKYNLANLLSIAPQVADYVWQTGIFAPDYVEGDS